MLPVAQIGGSSTTSRHHQNSKLLQLKNSEISSLGLYLRYPAANLRLAWHLQPQIFLRYICCAGLPGRTKAMKLSKALLVRIQFLAQAPAISCVALANGAHCVMYLQFAVQMQWPQLLSL